MNSGINFKKINTYDGSILYFGMTSNYKNIINGVIGYRYFDNAVYNNIPKMELISLISDSDYQFKQICEKIDDYEVAVEIQAIVSLKYLTNKKCVEILKYNDSKTYLYSIINTKLNILVNLRVIQNDSDSDSWFDTWFQHIDTFPEEIFETGTSLNFFPIISIYSWELYKMYCEIITDG